MHPHIARDDLIDACLYLHLNANPGLTVEGLRYVFKGFTRAEVEDALVRLAGDGYVFLQATS
ncbi:MAG: hypothetical protein ABIN25_11065, partial [Ginsengibacter sp.]